MKERKTMSHKSEYVQRIAYLESERQHLYAEAYDQERGAHMTPTRRTRLAAIREALTMLWTLRRQELAGPIAVIRPVPVPKKYSHCKKKD